MSIYSTLSLGFYTGTYKTENIGRNCDIYFQFHMLRNIRLKIGCGGLKSLHDKTGRIVGKSHKLKVVGCQ